MPNAEQQYYQAMGDLGFPRVGGGQKAKQMVKEQRREILNLLIQDGRENPAGADEEQFLKVIEKVNRKILKKLLKILLKIKNLLQK